METLHSQIAQLFRDSYRTAFKTNAPDWLEESLSYPDQAMGDIASSMALRIAKEVGQSPMKVAQELIAGLAENKLVKSATVAAPGYINLRLSSFALDQVLQAVADTERALTKLGDKKKVAMDYSHPNIGKPMGVHHLLSTIIGDAIKRTLRAGGYKVIADNFIGDLGTQFGKLIWAVKQWGDTAEIEQDPISELQKLYVRFHIEADTDVALDAAGREEYRKLEEGDLENRRLWHKIVKWSKAEIQPIYDTLGVTFDHMNGESFYEDKMAPILEDGVKKGVFVESEGALVCRADDPDSPPAILRKSDGATLYLTRDLARIAYWEQQWQPDTMMVVVDAAQSFAQSQLYEVARKLKLTDANLVQVNFGRMRFTDGSMSTRKGNILLLKDFIDGAKTRALALVQSKANHLSAPEQQQTAGTLAVGSIKYNILMQNRQSDIVFDWDNALQLDGNSAPYLMYAVVRIRSLLRKAQKLDSTQAKAQPPTWSEPIERDIILRLLDYQSQFERSLREYKPSIIATYLYNLAKAYNNLYNNLPILTAEEQQRAGRLALSTEVDRVMTHGMSCLGLEIPQKM